MNIQNWLNNRDRSLLVTACIVTVVMFVLPLGISFPLLDPDEGLHASITREMVERDQWLTPTLLGEPFFDKPILYFWAQAASVRWFGLSETAMRLPGLMFGLLGAVTTGLLAGGLFDRRTGLIAAILYATTILPTALAQAASHDVALIPWINLTLLMLWKCNEVNTANVKSSTPFRFILLAGMFLGLAILTKGIFGVAVVGLAYGGYLLFTRRWSMAIVLRGVAALGIAALVASPWYYLMEQAHPGYLRYYLLDRHVLGFFTESQPHGDQPWWYYFPILLGGGLPWIGYLPIVAREQFGSAAIDRRFWCVCHSNNSTKSGDESPHSKTLLWCWMIGWTLLMMLAGSKLATYLWPIFPPMAILAATAWKGWIDGSLGDAARRAFDRTFSRSSWTGPIVLPGAVLVVQFVYNVRFAWPVWTAVGVMAFFSLGPLIPWRAGRRQATLVAAAMSLAGQFVVVMTLILPVVAEPSSARLLAEHFNQQHHMPARLWIVEGRIGSLIYYLDPQLRAELDPERIQLTLAKELPEFQPGDMMAVQEWKMWKLRKYFDVDGKPHTSVGSYRLYEVGR